MKKGNLKSLLKTVAAAALSAAMVFTAAAPAFAADSDTHGATTKFNSTSTHSIKIQSIQAGHTYKAYQIFSGDYAAAAGSTSRVLSNIGWGDGIQGAAFLEALKKDNAENFNTKFAAAQTADDVATVLKSFGNDSQEINEFASLATKYDKTASKYLYLASVAGTSTEDAATKVATISGLHDGYYAVVDDTSAKIDEKDTFSKTIIPLLDKDAAITAKNEVPTIHKAVLENSTNQYNTVADAQIGKDVGFKLDAFVPTNIEDPNGDTETPYYFHVADTLSAGLTFQLDSVKVYVGEDSTANAAFDTAKYTAQTNENNANWTVATKDFDADEAAANPTFSVQFTEAFLKANKGKHVVILYNATLNKNAVVYDQANTNAASLIYSHNPADHAKHHTIPSEVPKVYTYEFNLYKYAEEGTNNNKPLAGAVFQLQAKDKDGNWETVKVTAKEDGTYYPDATSKTTEVTTPETGYVHFEGLDADTDYQLLETKAPDGYNPLAHPVSVYINRTLDYKNVTVTNVTVSSTLDGASAKGNTNAAKAGAVDGHAYVVMVLNKAGSLLPTTGGMGTVLFTVAGLCLMGGAALLLVLKKRKTSRA